MKTGQMMTETADFTTDGGAKQGGADLWCTYAAIRTLTTLAAVPLDPKAAVRTLVGRQNKDGGFAWQKGLPSDVWATYYCTQALSDLGEHVPLRAELAEWLSTLRHSSGGYAMTPGQSPDVWATYYAARTFHEVLELSVPGATELGDWLARLQRADGGLGWYPDAPESDVRACYYGVHAWRALTDADAGTAPPWRRRELTDWLRARQRTEGGFAFDDEAPEPCLWATFRAVRALAVLGSEPSDTSACLAWISSRRSPGSGWVRWESYATVDVWACFSAVGALDALGRRPLASDREDAVAFLHACELVDGGFTYRESEAAGDSLATAAALLSETVRRAGTNRLTALEEWLRAAHLPYEDGLMYMPGRGAEVRCTLWAAAALDVAGRPPLDTERLAGWCRRLQNRDGGFGYWHGRGSDLTATASAVELLAVSGVDPVSVIDMEGLRRFVETCAGDDGYRASPGGATTCTATAQAARLLALAGGEREARYAAALLAGFQSALGGSGAARRSVPDLMSTYQSVLTAQQLNLPQDMDGLRRFLDKVRADSGWAWSPLSRRSGGPLADSLGDLLDHHARTGGTFQVPVLNL